MDVESQKAQDQKEVLNFKKGTRGPGKKTLEKWAKMA